jgi:hypothetical protein
VIIPFGKKHKGKDTSEVATTYLMWMTNNDLYNQLYGDPWNDHKFKIPLELEIAAREELQKRGYRRIGQRWEKQ